jgi:hypothetical protein
MPGEVDVQNAQRQAEQQARQQAEKQAQQQAEQKSKDKGAERRDASRWESKSPDAGLWKAENASGERQTRPEARPTRTPEATAVKDRVRSPDDPRPETKAAFDQWAKDAEKQWAEHPELTEVKPENATPAAQKATEYGKKVGADILNGKWVNDDKADFLQHGYAYQTRFYITEASANRSPESVMKLLQENPDKIFPFGVKTTTGDSGVIKEEGAKLDLRGVRTGIEGLDKGNFVQVQDVSATQFTFRTLDGHFDGKDNLISFRTYQADGHIYLEQTAFAPNASKFESQVAPAGAKAISWPRQAENLRTEVNKLPL